MKPHRQRWLADGFACPLAVLEDGPGKVTLIRRCGQPAVLDEGWWDASGRAKLEVTCEHGHHAVFKEMYVDERADAPIPSELEEGGPGP